MFVSSVRRLVLPAALLLVAFLTMLSGIYLWFEAARPIQAESAPVALPAPALPFDTSAPSAPAGNYRVIGWNDLGMHCMNESFANLAVLPPFNTMWAQVILQGSKPLIITTGVTVQYSIVDNTYSAGKTDFWNYASTLFGKPIPANVGLAGATLAGQMGANSTYFRIEGIPLTPYRDSAPTTWYPYQLAHFVAKDSTTGQTLAETYPVAPVSTEMRCNTCHADGMQEGIATGNVETNILRLHDMESSTNLTNQRPVLCAKCHGSNALGAPGDPNLPNLSRAMHNKHAEETNNCYLCHPGQTTQCLRDVMFQKGLTCTTCHGGMSAVADPTRRPWIDLPRCETCHGANFAENPGTRYRDSKGHGGVYCEGCHGSPHAILPTVQANDNIQNIALQGYAGTLKNCRVCHSTAPTGPGPHGISFNPNTYFPFLNR